MPKADFGFALLSVEVSSISLAKQMAHAASRLAAMAKLREALDRHQRTLGRLIRQRPLQELGLGMAMGGELGKLREAASKFDFAPETAEWKQAAGRWRGLQGQALAGLGCQARATPVNPAALKKAFGLSLLAGSIALFLDQTAPRLSALVQEDRYKTALSKITVDEMV